MGTTHAAVNRRLSRRRLVMGASAGGAGLLAFGPACASQRRPVAQTGESAGQAGRNQPKTGGTFIDGRYLDAASGATFDTINPATGKLLARVAAGDEEDINRAVGSARAAFRQGAWANFAPAKRKKILLRFADAILKHTEELALLETLDMGKPISDSLKIDIPGANHWAKKEKSEKKRNLTRVR